MKLGHSFIDKTGNRYGKVVVLGLSHRDNRGYLIWTYQCDCGKTAKATSYNVKRTKSCGCEMEEIFLKKANNICQTKINRLTVIEAIHKVKRERRWYKCICECGSEVIVEGSKLKNGHTKSCGCLRNEVNYAKVRRLGLGVSNRNSLIDGYKRNAKNKAIRFDLDNDAMIKMFESSCFYCGQPPSTVINRKNTNGGYTYNGIDRLYNNPETGYIPNNTVACCSKCNYLKNNWDYDEFVKWIETVYSNLKQNGKLM